MLEGFGVGKSFLCKANPIDLFAFNKAKKKLPPLKGGDLRRDCYALAAKPSVLSFSFLRAAATDGEMAFSTMSWRFVRV